MQPSDNKKLAVEFLKLITAGKIDEAYEKYAASQSKHHNPFSEAGFDGLKKAMKENDVQFPNKQFEIKHVIGEDNLVAVHSHLILEPGKDLVVVHLFRFENGKIVELWDCGQPIPPDSVNKDGMF